MTFWGISIGAGNALGFERNWHMNDFLGGISIDAGNDLGFERERN